MLPCLPSSKKLLLALLLSFGFLLLSSQTASAAPTVETLPTDMVFATQAQLFGDLIDLDGASEVRVGFVYDTRYHANAADYAYYGDHSGYHQTNLMGGSGLFIATMGGLSSETTYHYRAVTKDYWTQAITAQGEDMTLTTDEAGEPLWISPTGHIEGVWENEVKTYDELLWNASIVTTPAGTTRSAWLYLTHDEIDSDGVRFISTMEPVVSSFMEIDVYNTGTGVWERVYTGSWEDNRWRGASFSHRVVTQVRIRFVREMAYSEYETIAGLSEVDFREYEACVDTVPDAPTLSSPANGATGQPTSPTLDWNDVSSWGINCAGNTNTYEVFLDTNPSPTTSQGTVGSGTTSMSVSGLAPGTTYYWKVRASNGAETADSPVWSFTTLVPNQPPNIPTLVAPPNNTWITYNPTFTATVSDPDGDNVRAYFSAPASNWGGWVASGNNSSYGPVSTACANGTLWRAYAQDTGGLASSWSGYWTLRVDTVDPLAILDQENGISADTSIWVNLTESDACSGVAVGDVDVRINGGSWTHYSNTTSNFNYIGSDGNTYEFRYRVQDNAGRWSPFSYDGSVTVQIPPTNQPPNIPTLIAPPNNVWICYSPTYQADVSDPNAGDIVHAFFDFSTVPTDGNGSSGATTHRSSYTPTTSDGEYWWRAKGVDDEGAESAYTGWWLVRKDTANPLATIDQENGISTDTSIWVNLTESDALSGVATGDVDVSIDDGVWTHYASTISNFTYTGSDGHKYEFRYRVQDNAGCWSSFVYDGSVTIELPPLTGTISGYVWEEDDPACSFDASEAFDGDDPSDPGYQLNVFVSGLGLSDIIDANGYYSISSVPYGDREVCADRPDPANEWGKECPSDTGNNCGVVTVDGNETLNFGFRRELQAWFQVIDGDIHAEQNIDNPVPN